MKPLLKGGQGRRLDESDAWTLWVLALAALLISLLSGCRGERVFSEVQGDSLPPPQERQYVPGTYPQVERVSEAEAERKMLGLEAQLQAERGLRHMLNGND